MRLIEDLFFPSAVDRIIDDGMKKAAGVLKHD